ncbi:hypothetical protein MKEN_00643600 [Mycena kentingensis (nom. inval.)]|nr:hypothetical protein MKEN_00643600 [Mycena kentingensis (nom. inval.)]
MIGTQVVDDVRNFLERVKNQSTGLRETVALYEFYRALDSNHPGSSEKLRCAFFLSEETFRRTKSLAYAGGVLKDLELVNEDERANWENILNSTQRAETGMAAKKKRALARSSRLKHQSAGQHTKAAVNVDILARVEPPWSSSAQLRFPVHITLKCRPQTELYTLLWMACRSKHIREKIPGAETRHPFFYKCSDLEEGSLRRHFNAIDTGFTVSPLPWEASISGTGQVVLYFDRRSSLRFTAGIPLRAQFYGNIFEVPRVRDVSALKFALFYFSILPPDYTDGRLLNAGSVCGMQEERMVGGLDGQRMQTLLKSREWGEILGAWNRWSAEGSGEVRVSKAIVAPEDGNRSVPGVPAAIGAAPREPEHFLHTTPVQTALATGMEMTTSSTTEDRVGSPAHLGGRSAEHVEIPSSSPPEGYASTPSEGVPLGVPPHFIGGAGGAGPCAVEASGSADNAQAQLVGSGAELDGSAERDGAEAIQVPSGRTVAVL